jgi:hypothetical protein
VKTEEFSTVDPYKMETMQEDGYMEVSSGQINQ